MKKYEKVLEILKTIETKNNFLNQIRRPGLSALELIAIDITAEWLSIDSEYQLFIIISDVLNSKIERSVYNRRRRKLFLEREQLRKKLAEQLIGIEKWKYVSYLVHYEQLYVKKII
jgi:hypothetical protein